MEFPTITAAKMDVANERIDSLMCSLYHTEVLKKFSQEEQNEGMLQSTWSSYVKIWYFYLTI